MIDKILNVQIFWVLVISIYAVIITIFTKITYEFMIKRQVKKNVAVYYNRKIVHIIGGGVPLLMVPFVFDSPIYPLITGLILATFTYTPFRRGKILYWVQTEENMNDVKFCLMWGVIVFILWHALGSPWIAIIPPAFMAFGDAVTGLGRNFFFQKRTKHPLGNVFMLIVSLPIGYFFAGIEGIAIWGVIAALVATFVERYEFGPIDDNILITVFASIILLIGNYVGPIV